MELEKISVFTKWISIMPNKMIDRFKNIYVSNISSNIQVNEITQAFKSKELVLNSMIFDSKYIAKSSYMFDVIIFFDVDNNLTPDLLIEFKENILSSKGEIWIICDNGNIGDEPKISYTEKILKDTKLRSNIVKYSDTIHCFILK